MSKNPFDDFTGILENFDAFCDEFENRASEAFLRGDQNDGRVTEAQSRIGEHGSEAVREVAAPGPADIPAGAPYVDVQASHGEPARDTK